MICLVSALVLLLASFPSAQGESKPLAVELHGRVELDEAAALRGVREKALGAAWEEFGGLWLEVVGPLVPRARAERELRAWLARALPKSKALGELRLRRFESSVGEAFRGETRFSTQGEAARQLLAAGEEQARNLRGSFYRRYLAIVLSCILLFVATGQVDRATQGYLTGRLRVAALVLAVLAALVIWPHGPLLLA
ncbi:MAG: hypothetical protein CSA62_06280 [Planctomycetota bacterium]|nr:MAG: hypothetical protein CSA62_06280 [Planctomycetota bacterium]